MLSLVSGNKSLSARLKLPFHAFPPRARRSNLPSEGADDQKPASKWCYDPAVVSCSILENIRRYRLAVEAQKLRLPASQRQFGEPRASVQEICEDTRLEAFEKLLEHGSVSFYALVAIEFQPVLFEAVQFANGPPQDPIIPTGSALIDTINAPFRALSYVEDQYQALGVDKELMNSVESYLRRRDFAGFWWRQREQGRVVDSPTMFVLLWDEVTRRSREVAMAATLCSNTA